MHTPERKDCENIQKGKYFRSRKKKKSKREKIRGKEVLPFSKDLSAGRKPGDYRNRRGNRP